MISWLADDPFGQQVKETYMTKKKFAERYFPYNREGAFWQGWLFSGGHCPYAKGTPQATAWHLGAEAAEDYHIENEPEGGYNA